MIGSDYEFRKYIKLSERIERDNSSDRNRERYKSRDSRSRSPRERYRHKRSRTRSRGRESPGRRKKTKSHKRPLAIIERVHSPSPSQRRGYSEYFSMLTCKRDGILETNIDYDARVHKKIFVLFW
jgi:hypothetical protein